MKPAISILDPAFQYVPSVATCVADTWRRFGWRPLSALERQRRAKTADERSDDRAVAAAIPLRLRLAHR